VGSARETVGETGNKATLKLEFKITKGGGRGACIWEAFGISWGATGVKCRAGRGWGSKLVKPLAFLGVSVNSGDNKILGAPKEFKKLGKMNQSSSELVRGLRGLCAMGRLSQHLEGGKERGKRKSKVKSVQRACGPHMRLRRPSNVKGGAPSKPKMLLYLGVEVCNNSSS